MTIQSLSCHKLVLQLEALEADVQAFKLRISSLKGPVDGVAVASIEHDMATMAARWNDMNAFWQRVARELSDPSS